MLQSMGLQKVRHHLVTEKQHQETPVVMGKFDLGVQNEVGKRLKEFCQESALVIANTLSAT